MAKVEGLNLRGSRWYLRIIIPGELVEVYGTTRKNVSLGTSDRKVAVVAATVKRAEWLAEFEPKRRERPLMRRAGFDGPTMDKITGHESGGSVGDVVYAHWLLEELRPAVEAIKYPFLKLKPVSPNRAT
jgi:hypothetical protein